MIRSNPWVERLSTTKWRTIYRLFMQSNVKGLNTIECRDVEGRLFLMIIVRRESGKLRKLYSGISFYLSPLSFAKWSRMGLKLHNGMTVVIIVHGSLSLSVLYIMLCNLLQSFNIHQSVPFVKNFKFEREVRCDILYSPWRQRVSTLRHYHPPIFLMALFPNRSSPTL